MCGEKSRGNWQLGLCLREDCINRGDDSCVDCFRFSKYQAPKDQPNDDGVE